MHQLWNDAEFPLVPLVKVFRARQTDDIALLFSTSLLKYISFVNLWPDFLLYCVPFYTPWTFFLSLVDPDRTWPKRYCYSTRVAVWSALLVYDGLASLWSVCWCTVSNGVQIRSAKNAFWLKCLKDLRKICVCPLSSSFGSLIDLIGAADRVMVTNT